MRALYATLLFLAFSDGVNAQSYSQQDTIDVYTYDESGSNGYILPIYLPAYNQAAGPLYKVVINFTGGDLPIAFFSNAPNYTPIQLTESIVFRGPFPGDVQSSPAVVSTGLVINGEAVGQGARFNFTNTYFDAGDFLAFGPSEFDVSPTTFESPYGSLQLYELASTQNYTITETFVVPEPSAIATWAVSLAVLSGTLITTQRRKTVGGRLGHFAVVFRDRVRPAKQGG